MIHYAIISLGLEYFVPLAWYLKPYIGLQVSQQQWLHYNKKTLSFPQHTSLYLQPNLVVYYLQVTSQSPSQRLGIVPQLFLNKLAPSRTARTRLYLLEQNLRTDPYLTYLSLRKRRYPFFALLKQENLGRFLCPIDFICPFIRHRLSTVSSASSAIPQPEGTARPIYIRCHEIYLQ
jgi:hypothetical protein